MNNPYAAPQTETLNTSSGTDISFLPRFSVWGVVGLTIITLGIYYIYWIYNRTKIANAHFSNKISSTLLNAFVVLSIVYYALSFISPFASPENIGLALASFLVSVAYSILAVVICFKLRNRICDEILEQPRFSGFLTFFLHIFYLQYKINEAIDKQ